VDVTAVPACDRLGRIYREGCTRRPPDIHLHAVLGRFSLRILGISAFYHDSAAALIIDGSIAAAAQEERFTRRKHDARFPRCAVHYCLEHAGLTLDQLDYVVFYEKPHLKFERLIETCLAFAPAGLQSLRQSLPLWVHEKLLQRQTLRKALEPFGGGFDWDSKLLFAEHHMSHAASAFFPSPFDDAVILTLDGVGEWATTSAAIGRGENIEIIKEMHFPHSLGLLYSAMTYYIGFRVNSGEYKVMGLAPYGEPRYVSLMLDHLMDLQPDGSFRLNMEYFNYCAGLTMTSDKFHALFGGPPRHPDEPLSQRHMDLAASIQVVLENAVLRLTRSLAAETGMPNLCMAGGVALNCVANGKVLRDGRFRRIWIQPAAGDAGGAVGAALFAYHMYARQKRTVCQELDGMKGSYLGPEFDQDTIERRLRAIGANFHILTDREMIAASVDALADGKAVGWFQGRMEFGPRALGARSILADARSPAMQSVLNLKIKYRESFRPFAPSVLREHVSEWFELSEDSPYMLLVADVAEQRKRRCAQDTGGLSGLEKLKVVRSEIPAVTHVDWSARIQTVHRETNPLYHALLSLFHERTGCPVLANTSFNVRGEPIVCTPEDAFLCFMGTEVEVLAAGNCFLRKTEQNPKLKRSYEKAFAPD
jgi:carbamoyltransferase